MAAAERARAGEELVERARGGDSRALDALWRAHRRWAAAILLAHAPPAADLEDLLQEVALAVVQGIGGLRQPGRFRSWLRTLALNVARTAGRRARVRDGSAAGSGATRARSARREPDEIDPHSGEPLVRDRDALEATEEGRRVLRAVQGLSVEFREPLILRCVHGYSQRRIADELGVPETTVETRLARARRRLREELAPSASRTQDRAGLPPGTGPPAPSGGDRTRVRRPDRPPAREEGA